MQWIPLLLNSNNFDYHIQISFNYPKYTNIVDFDIEKHSRSIEVISRKGYAEIAIMVDRYKRNISQRFSSCTDSVSYRMYNGAVEV